MKYTLQMQSGLNEICKFGIVLVGQFDRPGYFNLNPRGTQFGNLGKNKGFTRIHSLRYSIRVPQEEPRK